MQLWPLVVGKVREAVKELEMQNFDLEGFSLKELNDVELKRAVWDQNFKEICSFANFVSNVDGSLALESIRESNQSFTHKYPVERCFCSFGMYHCVSGLSDPDVLRQYNVFIFYNILSLEDEDSTLP